MSNKEILGLHRITKKHLKELCRKHKLYQTPHLNDQLYLHFQGFQAIENLEEYSGLKCLWLESNAISEIQGLDCQAELKCLFLQNNLIKKIENLNSCPGLDTLNLASNHITKIENCGVDILPVLSTLNLSRNYLRTLEAVEELTNCKYLCSLDLSHNRIEDILVVKVFASMPELRVLVLQGNPVVSRVPQYRKTLILECKNLTYLDTRPVFPKDRACAEAWKRGGYDEERREHERWIKMERKKIRDSVNSTLRLRQRAGAGDIQLLESTDDEYDNRQAKKPNLIQELEAPVRDDLEITGVVNTTNVAEQQKEVDSEMKEIVDDQETLQLLESKTQDISVSIEESTAVIQSDENSEGAFEIDKENDPYTNQDSEIKDEVQDSPEVRPERNFAVLDDILLQIESKSRMESAEVNSQLDPSSLEQEDKASERVELSEKSLEEVHAEELKQENENQGKTEETTESTIEMKSTSVFSERITINDRLESYRSFSMSTSSLSSDESSDISSISDEVFENSANQENYPKSDDNENLEHELKESIEQDSTEVDDTVDAEFQVQGDTTFVIDDDDSFTKSTELEAFEFCPKESTSNKCDLSSESNFADSEPSYIEGTDTCHHKDSDFEDRLDYTVSTCEEFEDTRADFDSSETLPKGACHTLFRSRLGAFCSQDFELPDEEDSGLLNSFHSVSTDSEFDSVDQAAAKLEDDTEVLVCPEAKEEHLTPEIDQSKTENVIESFVPMNETDEVRNEAPVDVTVSSNESENKTLIEIQAGYDDILSKMKEVAEIETTIQSFVAEASAFSKESDIKENSPENQDEKEENTEALPKLKEKINENSEEPPTWWEKTLAAARQEKTQSPIDSTSEDEEPEEVSGQLEDNIPEEQPIEANPEAFALLESILTESQKTIVQFKEDETPAEVEEASKSSSSNETEYESDDPFDHEIATSPTIHEVLTSFNEVAETIVMKNKQKSQQIQDLLSNPLTKNQESAETVNAQVEEMKLMQRIRVAKMVDEIYAQRDKYDDTLEVFDGRLMVVKRSTGALEELPPSKKHMSCGTSCGTSPALNEPDDSGSDDYGTADEDEGGDSNLTVEQHTSCTKISRRTSSTETSEEDIEQTKEDFYSLQKISKLHEDIDAEILPELGKWLKDGSLIPSLEPAIQKKEGKEEAMLMKKMLAESSELPDNEDSEIKPPIMAADESALDESSIKFENPE